MDFQDIDAAVWIQALADDIHEGIQAYFLEMFVVDFETSQKYKVDLVDYPQIDIAALVAALPDPEQKREPRGADDILFEPIPKQEEPKPTKDKSVVDEDEYLYEGLAPASGVDGQLNTKSQGDGCYGCGCGKC